MTPGDVVAEQGQPAHELLLVVRGHGWLVARSEVDVAAVARNAEEGDLSAHIGPNGDAVG